MYQKRLLRSLAYLSVGQRYLIAIVAGFIALGLGWTIFPGLSRFIVWWDGYAVTMLALAWSRIVSASPAVVVRIATIQHVSRKLLVLFTLGGACFSLGAVVFMLSAKGASQKGLLNLSLLLAMLTIVCSWFLVHTIFTLHYAFLFYRMPNMRRVHPRPQGLLFPGHGCPDYFDFAYFAFVIGMTSQVSDVQIATREIRRWGLLHGIISFGFNTVVLAMSINVISGVFTPGG